MADRSISNTNFLTFRSEECPQEVFDYGGATVLYAEEEKVD